MQRQVLRADDDDDDDGDDDDDDARGRVSRNAGRMKELD